MHPLKKRPHFGEQRSKITVNVRVNHLRFFVNDFFLKNSYYCIYFEGHKRNKVKTQTLTKSLESLTSDDGLKLDGSLNCTMTMFQDDVHRRYMDGKLKAKYKRIVVRQMTKLRSGEILYRDVGYVCLPLHKIIQEPDLFDTRLVMTHPANAIDAYVDVTIEAKLEGFMSSMPTSLDTPRSVLKSVQSGFNLIGLASPVIKNRFISIESQYFGESPAKSINVDLHALSELDSRKMNNFSLESIPADQMTQLSESNKSFFFSFWSKKNRPYNAARSGNNDSSAVILDEPKRAVHFTVSTKKSRATPMTNSGLSSDGDDCDEEEELEQEDDVPAVGLRRKGTALIRGDFGSELDDDDDEEKYNNNNNDNHDMSEEMSEKVVRREKMTGESIKDVKLSIIVNDIIEGELLDSRV